MFLCSSLIFKHKYIILRKAERDQILLFVEEKALEQFHPCVYIPDRIRSKEDRDRILSGIHCQDKKQWEQIENMKLDLNTRKTFFNESVVKQCNKLGSVYPWRYSKPYRI